MEKYLPSLLIFAVFETVDDYTRAFARRFGLLPAAYGREPVLIPFFIPYGAKFRKLKKDAFDMENSRNFSL